MKRKLLITLGGLTSIIAPVAAISCSCSSKATGTTETNSVNPTPPIEKAIEYKADKATYSYSHPVATFIFSERDTIKINEIISTFDNKYKQNKIRKIVISRDTGDVETFVDWIYHPLNRDSFYVEKNVNTPEWIETKINDQNLLQLTIGFNSGGTVQANEKQSLANVKKYIYDKSVQEKIDSVCSDIRKEVQSIWNIFRDAITAIDDINT